MSVLRKMAGSIGVSRLLIGGFLLCLIVAVIPLGINPGLIYGDCLTRIGMNGTLVLAMMISILCGAGLNFGLPIGILCGLLGGAIACEYNMTGMAGLLTACALSVPFAAAAGWLYAKLLNHVKGSEMTVGNYMAFSMVSLMSLMWLLLPFSNAKLTWPMTGKGLRSTLTLEDNYAMVLDHFLEIDFHQLGWFQNSSIWKDFGIPTGILLAFALMCLIVWVFTKTKYGVMMRCSGANPRFVESLGVNSNQIRTVGIMISTVLAAIGINIYAQSYGFYQFYTAPLMMAFPAMAAILIGGATPKKAKVSHVIIGVILFQSLLTLATPVANELIQGGTISEEIRKVIQNGVIIYALTKTGAQRKGR